MVVRRTQPNSETTGTKKVEDFKYLGSTAQMKGECGKWVCVLAGWNGWRKVSGLMCSKRVSMTRMKRQETELEVAGVKVLGFSLGVTRMDKIRNEFI